MRAGGLLSCLAAGHCSLNVRSDMNQPEPCTLEIQAHLGYKALNRPWAKVEVFLGLVAVWIGLFLAFGLFFGNPVRPFGAAPEPGWPLLFSGIASLVLFCGGG